MDINVVSCPSIFSHTEEVSNTHWIKWMNRKREEIWKEKVMAILKDTTQCVICSY
jgi:hypothetical protein